MQKEIYEGISYLCFYSGRLGHKQENCYYKIHSQEKARKEELASPSLGSQEVPLADSNFGEWMLITRKKHLVKNGQACVTNLIENQPDRGIKGKMVKPSLNLATYSAYKTMTTPRNSQEADLAKVRPVKPHEKETSG